MMNGQGRGLMGHKGKRRGRRSLAGRTPALSVGQAMREGGGCRAGRARATWPAFALEQLLERVEDAARDLAHRSDGGDFDKGHLFGLYECADWARWQMQLGSEVASVRWRSRRLAYFDPDGLLQLWTAAMAGKQRRRPLR